VTFQAATVGSGRRRVYGSVAAAGVLALLLAGCGSEDGGSGGGTKPSPTAEASPAEAVKAAADAGEKKATVRFAMTMEIGVLGATGTSTAKGQLDLSKPAMSMTATITSQGEKPQKLGAVLIGNTAYQKGPGEKRWTKVAADESGEFGIDLSQAGTDPTGTLELLKGAADVKQAGSETVNGVETTKYTGTIADDALGEPGTGGAAEESAGDSGSSTMPFEVYIDGDGLPARVAIDASDEPDPENPELGGLVFKVTQDFTDWGSPVTIKAPKGAVSPKKSG
jgi:hypothetical protein